MFFVRRGADAVEFDKSVFGVKGLCFVSMHLMARLSPEFPAVLTQWGRRVQKFAVAGAR